MKARSEGTLSRRGAVQPKSGFVMEAKYVYILIAVHAFLLGCYYFVAKARRMRFYKNFNLDFLERRKEEPGRKDIPIATLERDVEEEERTRRVKIKHWEDLSLKNDSLVFLVWLMSFTLLTVLLSD